MSKATINVTTGQFWSVLGLLSLWFLTFFVGVSIIFSYIGYEMSIEEVSVLHDVVFHTSLVSALVSGFLTYTMGYLTRKWETSKNEESTPG